MVWASVAYNLETLYARLGALRIAQYLNSQPAMLTLDPVIVSLLHLQ